VKSLALAAIRFYQHFISPHKGFCCAYREHTGHGSCSALGYRAIRRFGVWRGIGVLRNRIEECGKVHRNHLGGIKMPRHQAGFCDLSCDLPFDLDCASAACDFFSEFDLPCDCGGRASSARKKDKKRPARP